MKRKLKSKTVREYQVNKTNCIICNDNKYYTFKPYQNKEITQCIEYLKKITNDTGLDLLINNRLQLCPYCFDDKIDYHKLINETNTYNHFEIVKISQNELDMIGKWLYSKLVIKAGIDPLYLNQLKNLPLTEALLNGQRITIDNLNNIIMNYAQNISKEYLQPEKELDINLTYFGDINNDIKEMLIVLYKLLLKIRHWYPLYGDIYANNISTILELFFIDEKGDNFKVIIKLFIDKIYNGLFINTYKSSLKIPNVLLEHYSIELTSSGEINSSKIVTTKENKEYTFITKKQIGSNTINIFKKNLPKLSTIIN